MRGLYVGLVELFSAAVLPGLASAAQPAKACEKRANNTYNKLLGCVTLDGVREHQEAFQAIADANDDPFYPGTRAAGTEGYDESVEYVAGLLEEAGYEVTLDPVQVTGDGEVALGDEDLGQVSARGLQPGDDHRVCRVLGGDEED